MSPVKPFTPIQYIIGRCCFMGLDLKVDSRVLIPRPETELLVDVAAGIVRRASTGNFRILDLCTGSGAIALSLTKNCRDCIITASDISAAALGLARENAARNGLDGAVRFVESDLFDRLPGAFDLVVSNPPYIAGHEFDGLQREVLAEPRIALYGGEDGLDFYRRIFTGSQAHLSDGAHVAVEIGYGQLDGVRGIIDAVEGFSVESWRADHNGIPRVIVARWKN